MLGPQYVAPLSPVCHVQLLLADVHPQTDSSSKEQVTCDWATAMLVELVMMQDSRTRILRLNAFFAQGCSVLPQISHMADGCLLSGPFGKLLLSCL